MKSTSNLGRVQPEVVNDLSMAPCADVLEFLGATACRVVFRQVITQDMPREEQKKRRSIPSPLFLAEYVSGKSPSLIRFPDLQVNSPYISPDGRLIVFCTATATSPICILDIENYQITQIGVGNEPSWWMDSKTGELCIIYRSASGRYENLPDGTTFCQRLDDQNQPLGEPEKVFSHGFSGGVSVDGRYLATGYTQLFVADLSTQKIITPLGEEQLPEGRNQVCNVNIAPDETSRLLCLRIPHQIFSVIDFESGQDKVYKNPPGTLEWQTPRWSTAGDYVTASAQEQDGNYSICLIKLSTSEVMHLTGYEGYLQGHLWMSSK
jgi:hypothetical protein